MIMILADKDDLNYEKMSWKCNAYLNEIMASQVHCKHKIACLCQFWVEKQKNKMPSGALGDLWVLMGAKVRIKLMVRMDVIMSGEKEK